MECGTCGYAKLRVTDSACPACYTAVRQDRPSLDTAQVSGGSAIPRAVRAVAIFNLLLGSASVVALGLVLVLFPLLLWAMARSLPMLLWGVASVMALVGGNRLRKGRASGAWLAAVGGSLLLAAAGIDLITLSPAGDGDRLGLFAGLALVAVNALALYAMSRRARRETRLK